MINILKILITYFHLIVNISLVFHIRFNIYDTSEQVINQKW